MPTETAMRVTVPVSYRMPKPLFQRATRYAESVYQPTAVIFRLALAEFLDTHDVPDRRPSGLSVIFPPVNSPDRGDDTAQPVDAQALAPESTPALSAIPYTGGVTGPTE